MDKYTLKGFGEGSVTIKKKALSIPEAVPPSIKEIDLDMRDPVKAVRAVLGWSLGSSELAEDIKIIRSPLGLVVNIESPSGVAYEIPVDCSDPKWREELSRTVGEINEAVGCS